MVKKTKLSFLALFLCACQVTPSQNSNQFAVKSDMAGDSRLSPQATASGSPSETQKISIQPSSPGVLFEPKNETKVEKPRFDGVVPTENSANALPGSVTVIYKNANKIRIDKASQTIKASASADLDSVELILRSHSLKHADDFAYPGVSDERLDLDVRQVSEKYNIEAPHRKSIHLYQFAVDADTKAIAALFRKLPFVRTAYMTPRVDTAVSTTQLSSHSLTSTMSAPNDTGFSNTESTNWWWFNRSKVFHGWNYFSGTSLPIIAVVDTGFDNRSATTDKPTYLSGMSIQYNPLSSPQWVTGSDIFQYPADNPSLAWSHGSFVASVAASPKSNSDGYAGIAPGASIRPYKLVSYCFATPCNPTTNPANYSIHSQAIANGIFQASYSDADVISVSMQTASYSPIIADPAINNEVVSASVSRGKPVVIAAGNGSLDIDYTNQDPSDPTLPSCGDCIIVGGSQNDTSYHSKAWSGSNFGDRVDLGAGAYNISATTFTVSSAGSAYQQTGAAGTSFATPMVSATVGMMKKIAQAEGSNLTPSQLRGLVIHSSTSNRYTAAGGYPYSETYFIGKGLGSGTDAITSNPYSMVGLRELNVYNALVLAKNSSHYQAMARIHNVDDYIWLAFNGNWGTYYQKGFGEDAIYGLNGLSSGNTINFATYNAGAGGSYAYGYQVYRGATPVFDSMGGVAYITGVQNNASFSTGWYQGEAYTY